MAQVQSSREPPDVLPRALDTALFLLGLGGIAALFLPFAGVLSPWDVTGKFERGLLIFLLGTPFLLAVPISAAWLLIITRRLVRPCWIAAYVLGLAAAGSTLCFACLDMIELVPDRGVVLALVPFAPSLVTLISGGAFVIRNARLDLPHTRNSVFAMQVAYVAGALIPMIMPFPWNIGAYITLVTVVAYVGHIIAVELVVRGTRAPVTPALR